MYFASPAAIGQFRGASDLQIKIKMAFIQGPESQQATDKPSLPMLVVQKEI